MRINKNQINHLLETDFNVFHEGSHNLQWSGIKEKYEKMANMYE